MRIPFQKTVVRLAFCLLVPLLLLESSSCSHTSNETWHCYDANGRPVADVLFICRYDLAADYRTGVNYRFSDTSGKVVLDLDKDTPRGLIRCHECIYSSRLHSGDMGLGGRWNGTPPRPDNAVVYDGGSGRIYLKDGTNHPLVWYTGIQELIAAHRRLAKFPNGGARMASELRTMVARERASFLQRYGDSPVPAAYFTTSSFRIHRDALHITSAQSGHLAFKDIILPLSKP